MTKLFDLLFLLPQDTRVQFIKGGHPNYTFTIHDIFYSHPSEVSIDWEILEIQAQGENAVSVLYRE